MHILITIHAGMLLLLKETYLQGRFSCEFNYLKNVEGLMAFKKSCGNVIKFSTQNIPHAVIQVILHYIHTIKLNNFLMLY